MKLTLDRAKLRLPFWLYLVITLLCIGVALMQFPVSWVSSALGGQTACRVVLQEPMGTIWQGSAALGFSESNAMGGWLQTALGTNRALSVENDLPH